MQGIDLVARISNGKLSGCSLKSEEVSLVPGRLTGGEYIGDSITAGFVDIFHQSLLRYVND
jgi:RNA 3'-terminal phosphate cyclase